MTCDLIHRLYDDCINPRRLDDACALIAPDFMSEGKPLGYQGWREGVERVLTAFPDAHFMLDDMIEAGNRIALRWHFDATHSGPIAGLAATGRPVHQNGIAIYRQSGGRLTECWQQVDRLGLLEQIGAKVTP